MPNQLDRLRIEALTALDQVYDEAALRAWYAAHLSKKSPLMTALGDLGKLPKEQRVEIGKRGNEVKRALEAAFAEKEQAVQMAALERSLKENAVDVTLPGCQPRAGHLHPVTQTMRQMCAILAQMGFQVYAGPEVELDEFNFTLLNMPLYHPAREMHDTFWLDGGLVLRTHTSPNQVRIMRGHQPPFRAIVPGKCYRVDLDASHNFIFHQIEGCAGRHDPSAGSAQLGC